MQRRGKHIQTAIVGRLCRPACDFAQQESLLMSHIVSSLGVENCAASHGSDAALERACEIIVDAGQAGARWAIFPEGAIPGHPAWLWAIGPGADPPLDLLHTEALASAVRIPSDITDRLCAVAQRARVNVAIGLIERDDAAGASYFNTVLIIDAMGQIIGAYRIPLLSAANRPIWVSGQKVHEHGRSTATVGGI
jgi:predicted amidohydrolase